MALINLRNALMAGKRLPYDAEVEFLESTGTQWINTGYMLSGPTTFKLSASFTPTRDERDFFGAHSANTQGSTVCGCYRNFVFGYNYPHARIDGASLGSSEITTDIEYALSQSSRTLKVNGTTYSGNGATFPNLAVTLFRGNENTAYYGQFKCYAFQIYDANGAIVRDYIPVRKGTVGYLYDRVSGKLFGNAGTGDFVLGQDVVPVEYIESHGTEWINTGYVGTDTSGFSVEIMPLVAIDRYFFGSRPRLVSDDRWLAGSFAGPQVYIGWNTNTFSSWTLNAKHIVENNFLNIRKKVCDGVIVGQISTSLNPQNGKSAYIFSANDPAVSSRATCRVYTVKVSENTTLVRSYRSIRVGTDATSWEGAMMDVLTRRIYRNAGTGAFGYGNDLKYPIPAS